jgi:hypothetical protein
MFTTLAAHRDVPVRPADDLSAARRILVALLAGGLAIALNAGLLAAADRIPLVTARGGLLKLLRNYLEQPLAATGIGACWARFGLPSPTSAAFQAGFHVVVGLAMAVLRTDRESLSAGSASACRREGLLIVC